MIGSDTEPAGKYITHNTNVVQTMIYYPFGTGKIPSMYGDEWGMVYYSFKHANHFYCYHCYRGSNYPCDVA